MGTEPGGEQGAAPSTVSATLLERMVAAGVGEERARGHIARGVVRVAGEPVLDVAAPVPWPAAWIVGPE